MREYGLLLEGLEFLKIYFTCQVYANYQAFLDSLEKIKRFWDFSVTLI
jgi:hypothetical protein